MPESTTTPYNTAGIEARRLRRIASNLRWSWHRPTADLLASLPGWNTEDHPVTIVDRLVALSEAESDEGTSAAGASRLAVWLSQHNQQVDEIGDELDELESAITAPSIAYFCPEFGIAAQLPQYSGGLGILAGDHLKSASDLGLPLIAVGLFYRQGFFRQEIVNGVQVERIEAVEPAAVGAGDTGSMITVSVDGEAVQIRVWEMRVGAIHLLLLDSAVEGNSASARKITDQLYS